MPTLCSLPGLDWELDISSREIVRDGRRVRLPEKPYLVLQALLDARGDVVTRATLQKLLWPDDTFVDFDNNLNSAVATLRHVLVKAGSSSRQIETIPKVGYRLVVPAANAAPSGPTVANDAFAARENEPGRGHAAWWSATGALGAGIIAVVLGMSGGPWRSAPPVSTPATVNSAAREQFNRAVFLRSQFFANPHEQSSALDAARGAFAQAFALDPGFAAAAAEEADVLVDMSFAGRAGLRDGLLQARSAARRALDIDAGRPTAARVLAMTALVLEWDFEGARRWLDLAARDRADARTSLAEATWSAAAGRFDEAVRAAERAVTLDPAANYLRADLAMFYLAAGRNAEAARSSELVLQAAPGFAPARAYALIAHERLQQWDDAARHARALASASGASAGDLARLDDLDGRQAVRLWRELERVRLERHAAGRPGEFALQLALRHAGLGDRDAAIRELGNALSRRDAMLVFVRMYPELAALRGDPAFQRIAGSVGAVPNS